MINKQYRRVGKAIYVGESNWPPLIKDNSASEKTVQAIVDCLNHCSQYSESDIQQGIYDRGLKGIPLHQGPHKKDHYCENWQPDPAIEEAVRVVDGMTCEHCRLGYEDADDFKCTAQGRAIIDALIERGLIGRKS